MGLPDPQQSAERSQCLQILEGSRDGVCVTGREHRIVFLNPAMARMAGTAEAKLLGRDLRSALPKQMADVLLPSYLKAYQSLELVASTKPGDGAEGYTVRVSPYVDGAAFAGMICLIYCTDDLAVDHEHPHDELIRAAHDWQMTFDATSDAIWIVDREQRILRCNRAVEQLFGLSCEEMVGKHCWEIAHRTDRPVEGCPMVRARQSLQRETMELQIAARWFLVVADPVVDEVGDFNGAIHIITDISEVKQAEEALRESEERLRLITDASAESIWQLDLGGRVTYVSKAVQDVFGYNMEEAVALGFEKFFLASNVARAREAFAKVVSGERYQLLELLGRRKDGSAVPIEASVLPIIREGEIVGVQGIARDISARRQAEEALREREKQYRSIFESVSDGLIIFDRIGRVVEVNPAVHAMHGYTREEMIGMSGTHFVHSDFHERFAEFCQVAMGELFVEEPIDLRKDGSAFPVQVRGSAFEFRGESHILAVITDITERKQAEQALRDSEQRFSTITENSADAIFVVDRVGRYTYVNKAACELLGYMSEELIGMGIEDLLPEDLLGDGQRILEQLLDAGKLYVEIELLCKDRRRIPVDLNAVVLPNGLIFSSCRDLTDRKRAEAERIALEAQLRQAQKLESIGTLASGVAHEINNPLTGVINYAELLKGRVVSDARGVRYADAIIDEGHRISAIVKNLLSFSRQSETGHSMARIRDIVDKSLALLRTSLLKHRIDLTVAVAEDLPSIRCSSQQIQQVIVNLITNAQSALNERYPGYDPNKMLSISAESLTDGEGEWLRIVVEDHGGGIPEELRPRVFDPFFTSKPRYQGTGLGLSVSHGIVLEHKGRIGFDSKEGESTRFYVDLPLQDEA